MDKLGRKDTELEIVQRDGYTDVRFLGHFSVEGFQRRATAASQACRDGGSGRLFVDATCYDVSPTTLERYELGRHAVTVSAGLTVALLITPTFLDPAKFGLMVAQNRGLRVEGFTDRQKAINWLLASPPGDARRPTS
jgi:hypothetical protein